MKKTTWIVIIAIVAVIFLVGSWFWTSYNSLVVANENVDGQWAQVETQYQRRFDLIPSLVGSVKLNMVNEQKIFTDIAKARQNYSGAKTVDSKVAATSEVEGALSRLLVIIEAYPQLRTSELVSQLMSDLAGTENRVSVERMRFNDTVKAFNMMTKRFPMNVLSSLYGFPERIYFQVSAEASQAPVVDYKDVK